MGKDKRTPLQVSIHAPAWGATFMTPPFRLWLPSFNPRPRVGGDTNIQARWRSYWGFNPRPRVGGDWDVIRKHWLSRCFNPRPRVGGDYPADHVFYSIVRFQSTPPRGGRHCCVSSGGYRGLGFNPRPRVGGDQRYTLRDSKMPCVSIHAPAWGATH